MNEQYVINALRSIEINKLVGLIIHRTGYSLVPKSVEKKCKIAQKKLDKLLSI
jgi:hypothetical protein